MDSKFQASLLKEPGDISCSCRRRGSNEIFLESAFPLIGWMDVLNMYIAYFSEQWFRLFQFTDLYFLCSWWIVFTLESNFFSGHRLLVIVNSSKQWWDDQRRVNQRCQIKPLPLPWHFQLTWPTKKLSEVHVHRLLAVKLKGNSCFLLLAMLC